VIIHFSSVVNLPEFGEEEIFPCLPHDSHDMAFQIPGMWWPAIMLYTKGSIVPGCLSQLRMILHAILIAMPAFIFKGNKQVRKPEHNSPDLPPPPGCG